METKIRILLSGLVLVALVGGSQVVAVMNGHSNAPGGTFITQPAGSAVLQGSLPTTYHQGMQETTRFDLTNSVGSTIVAHLELTLSRPGISSSDVTVTLAGNVPVLITCDGTNCTYIGTRWTIYTGTTTGYDVGATVDVY